MAETPTIFLVDDDQGMRESLTLLLELSGFRVRSFASGQDFLDVFAPDEWGCLILDLRMPVMSGLDLQRVLLSRGCTLPIIFLSAYGDIPTTVLAMQGGAVDFLEKPVFKEVLIERIEAALAEDRRQRSAVAEAAAIRDRYDRLTQREQEVLRLATQGMTNKQIARELMISPRTVENHRARMMEKMGATNITELCRMAGICL